MFYRRALWHLLIEQSSNTVQESVASEPMISAMLVINCIAGN
jgi:hypothetical protein